MRSFTKTRNQIRRAAVVAGVLGMLCSTASAQNSVLAQPQPAPDSIALQEKIYLQTDKIYYLAGEILWFKMYCMESTSHRLLDLSKVAYVEVLDQNNKPALQAKIALEKGEGSGSFALPVTLGSGSYLIRAYTSWMKNAGADLFFEKQVTIVNSLKQPDSPVKDTTYFLADFFPEGGNLVTGYENRIAFKVTDPSLHGVQFYGAVVNDRRDTVARFSPYRFGMGTFSFTPRNGEKYRVILNFADHQTMTRDLPPAMASGYLLQVEDAGNKINVRIKGNGQAGELLLVASNRKKTLVAERVVLGADSTSVAISKDQLSEGINVMTLFDQNRRPVCERLFFKKPVAALAIDASSDAPSYGPRKEIRLSVTTHDAASGAVPASMSLSVYRLDSLQMGDEGGIVSYLWLGSEIRGRIESPGYYFTHDDRQAEDNLMLTYGWRRFRPSAKQNTTSKMFALYGPEYYGHLVICRVFNAATGQPERDIQTYLSVPGLYPKFDVKKSDDSGFVRFDVKDHYGPGEIVVQTQAQDNGSYRIEVSSPFSDEVNAAPLPLFRLQETDARRITERSIGMQVQHVYTEDSLTRFQLPLTDTLPFYGRADHEYLLDNYTRFVTMEEVLREYVREINVRNRGGGLEMVMLDEPHRDFFNGNMLVLMDGVPVFDQSKIFSYDPLKVKKLDVVPTQYFLGYYAFNGIASFTTYKGELDGFQIDPKALVLDYDGLQLQREFYSPAYSSPKQLASRLPDFRTVLRWSPNLHTGPAGKAELSFYSSDLKGKYQVVVEAITEDGKAADTSFPIEIK